MLTGIPKSISLRSTSSFDTTNKSGPNAGNHRIFQRANLYNGEGCGGENKMIHLAWDPVQGAASYALICVDLHPVAHKWVHLYVPHLAVLDGVRGNQNLDSAKSVVGLNSFGKRGYGGPCPPPGSGEHKYVFYLFALKRILVGDGDKDGDKDEEENQCRNVEQFLQKFGRDAVIGYGEFEAYYGRD